jgi:hypothetical protein
LVPSSVPLLPLLRLRLVHAPERERGGVLLALRRAHAVHEGKEVEALAVRFAVDQLAAVASSVGTREPPSAVLVSVRVHLPAEDALAVLVELLDQPGELAVVPEPRAAGTVSAGEVLCVALDAIVGEGPSDAIPSRRQALQRRLGTNFIVVIGILIVVAIVVVRREVEGALPVLRSVPELALVPRAVVVQAQDAHPVRATLVVRLAVVSAGEVVVDEGLDLDVIPSGRRRGRLALHPQRQGPGSRDRVCDEAVVISEKAGMSLAFHHGLA